MTMNTAPESTADPVLSAVRCWLLVALLLGWVGLSVELLLLNHTEDFWQLSPLLLMIAATMTLGWYALGGRKAALRVFQVVMVLFMAGGITGVMLHLQGKMEFKRETDPSLAGWALFQESLKGAVPPVLAPAALIQFGILGLAFTFRHPALASSKHIDNSQPQPTP
jgi:hypothetical protein